MERNKYPEYFTFNLLAKLLDVKLSSLITDCIRGNIGRYSIDWLSKPSSENAQVVIDKLQPILNKYARRNIVDGPKELLTSKTYRKVNIKGPKLNRLLAFKRYSSFFDLWLKEHGIDINNVQIVIPKDEVINYILYLKDLVESTSRNRFKNSSEAEKYVDDCLSQGKSRKEITIELVEKYGSEKQKYYGLIGKKLAGYDEEKAFSKSTWRLRGFRFYSQIKNNT